MKVTFLGATGTVTGSKYLVECAGGTRVLVDCGLFQGPKGLRERNWKKLAVPANSIDAVVLTHAHIDHTGYLPALVKHGYSRDVFCTPGTRDLAAILLPDCGHLQEEDARHANKWGYSKHRTARPLFTQADATASLRSLQSVPYGKRKRIGQHVWATFHTAGHILGSAFIVLEDTATRLLFSGDVGRPVDRVMRPPADIPTADYVVCESTYGDRLHQGVDTEEKLAEVIVRSHARGGSVVVPAFAVGRAQALLFLLSELKRKKTIPDVPVFLDSPMAINASDVYCRYHREHRLDDVQCEATCTVAEYLRTPEQSKSLNDLARPFVVLSASGMATGGRVLHHLKRMLPDARNSVLLAGYQALGTRGRTLAGACDSVRIHGEDIPVRASVDCLDHLSAHADRDELVTWLRTAENPPRRLLITHGEADAARSFADHVSAKLGWTTQVPNDGEVIDLG